MSYVKRYERSGYGVIQNKHYYYYNCILSVFISRTHILYPDDRVGHSLCCTGGWYFDISGQVRYHSHLHMRVLW